MTLRFVFFAAASCLLTSCSIPVPPTEDKRLPPWPFTCVHEKANLATMHPDADHLYRYGRTLESGKPGRTYHTADTAELDEVVKIARYYRIAAAHGHHQAKLALIELMWRVYDNTTYDGVATPFGTQRAELDERLTQELVDQGIASGFLRRGFLAKQDWDLKLAVSYFRQASDLGNPKGQFHAAMLLDEPPLYGPEPNFALQDKMTVVMALYRCSADQGYGDSILAIAYKMKLQGNLKKATELFQRGVSAGSPGSAYALKELLGIDDKERERRYEELRVFLIDKQDWHPRIIELDKIVPLPPAPLPEWDGTISWRGDTAEAFAADKPSEQLIARMAKEKGLDQKTGLPRQ